VGFCAEHALTDLTKLVKDRRTDGAQAADLAKRLEERGSDYGEKIDGTQGVNEGLACEAIGLHLEGREQGIRSDVEWPESEPTLHSDRGGIQDPCSALCARTITAVSRSKASGQMEARAAQFYHPSRLL